jgi:hypothetical protein
MTFDQLYIAQMMYCMKHHGACVDQALVVSCKILLYRSMDSKKLLSSTDSLSQDQQGVLVHTPFLPFFESHVTSPFLCMMDVSGGKGEEICKAVDLMMQHVCTSHSSVLL